MTGRPERGFTVAGMIVALGATTVLMIGGGSAAPEPAAPATRMPVAAAWPTADLVTIADLPLRPMLFVDTTTVIGTSPTDDSQFLRLLLRYADGATREFRRLLMAGNPRFENLTIAGDDVVWTEYHDGGPPQIWAANLSEHRPATRLTGDLGNAVFYGSAYELVPHDGRVYWTATPEDGSAVTEIRSVALTGGDVDITREPGSWTMAPWPWLDDGAGDGAAAVLLRERGSGREVTVPSSGGELPACTPIWCRVLVVDDEGVLRIDLMRPDGSQRRQIAGRGIRPAVTDPAILDRFEILAELGPQSTSSGTARLLVHDISTGDTVELDPAANDAQSRNGLVWWYSSAAGVTRWQVLDLRTI
jgi:hypothetical protein